MSKQEIKKLIVMKWLGVVKRSEILKHVSDRELTELEIEMYPILLKAKGLAK